MIDVDLLEHLEGFLTPKRKALFKDVLKQRTRHITVVLENINQPHNASAVVRSCDIFGIQDVYTVENDYINNVSRHVAKGSQKWLNFHRFKSDTDNTPQCLDTLKAKGYQIIGTTPHETANYLHDFDITKKTAFVFGEERDGISDYVKTHADGFLKIPMVGFTESLNISVAVAIILQSVTSRLRNSDVHWRLTDIEKKAVYFNWIKTSLKDSEKLISAYEQHKASH